MTQLGEMETQKAPAAPSHPPSVPERRDRPQCNTAHQPDPGHIPTNPGKSSKALRQTGGRQHWCDASPSAKVVPARYNVAANSVDNVVIPA